MKLRPATTERHEARAAGRPEHWPDRVADDQVGLRSQRDSPDVSMRFDTFRCSHCRIDLYEIKARLRRAHRSAGGLRPSSTGRVRDGETIG